MGANTFAEELRQKIIDKITENGGQYTGDLSRKVTHLIVYRPEGRKYVAAKSWNIFTVHIQWLHDSVARGMILDEGCYDPLKPPEEIGHGAVVVEERPVSRGKRQRDAIAAAEEQKGRRKLRKTASMKFSSQRENLWGDILGKPVVDSTSNQTDDPTRAPLPPRALTRMASEPNMRVAESIDQSRASFDFTMNTGTDEVFANCCFYAFGFDSGQAETLVSAVSTLGGKTTPSYEKLTLANDVAHRFVIVAQASDPKTHPIVPDGVQMVTEVFIEKCLHKKMFYNPKDHVIGRPFPVSPIAGFDKLLIGTAGFIDVDLLHIVKAIRQLGAKYAETFNAQTSVLVATSLSAIRKTKLDIAIAYRVPVVRADWLWNCISQGVKLPIDGYLFREVAGQTAPSRRQSSTSTSTKSSTKPSMKVHSDKVTNMVPKALPESTQRSSKSATRGADMSAFDPSPLAPTEPPVVHTKAAEEESMATTHFETAPSQQLDMTDSRPSSRPGSKSGPVPLSQRTASELNRPASPSKHGKEPAPRKSLARVRSEVCDSETDEDGHVPGHDDDETLKISAEQAEEMARRQLEKEKADKAAAERLALSSKLTSLLETTTGAGAGVSLESISARDEDVAARPPPPARRKRGIMGRAISNVSAASSGSAESVSGGGLARVVSISTASQQDEEEAVYGKAPPAGTQLEYEDPDAKKNKARLMSKMLGTSVGGSVKTPLALGDDRFTLKGANQKDSRAGGGPSKAPRSMRKR